jgi:putative ABC transport system permease protein
LSRLRAFRRRDRAMTFTSMIWSNLVRRRVRTLLTAAGVAVGVGLIVALVSISAGVKRASSDLIHVGRADFGLFQGDVPDFTRSLLPDALAAKVAREPGVAQVARIKLLVTRVDTKDSFLVFGLDDTEFVAGRLVLIEGSRPQGVEALVGDNAASGLKARPGSVIRIGGRRVRVAGIFHSGNRFEDSAAVLPLETVERMSGRPGEITTIAVVVWAGVPPASVADRLERRFSGTTVVREPGQAAKVDTSSRLLIDSGWVFSLLALVIGGLGMANTMAMSVFERTREIGILRAVGWPTRRIGLLIVGEALGICLLALGAGLGLGLVAAQFMTTAVLDSPLISPVATASVFLWGLVVALLVAVFGAAYPTWRAVRLTPVQALGRE